MSAVAGLFGFGSTNWKEEALQNDGSKIIVERSFSRGGMHEMGQGAPIKEQDMTFTLPGSNKTVTWKSEYCEDVGRSNFNLLALHVLNGAPYIVTEPNLCLSYNKWGRPNPPYVFFKYDGKDWQRIPLTEFPAEFTQFNLVNDVDDQSLFSESDKHAVIPAATVKELNSQLTQAEYKTIARIQGGYSNTACPVMIRTKEGWEGLGFFKRQSTYEACLKYCEWKEVSNQNCPCEILFGKK